MNVKKELGLKIKRIRQKEGLTQEQFAEKIGIATRTLAGIEIGESFVSAQTTALSAPQSLIISQNCFKCSISCHSLASLSPVLLRTFILNGDNRLSTFII